MMTKKEKLTLDPAPVPEIIAPDQDRQMTVLGKREAMKRSYYDLQTRIRIILEELRLEQSQPETCTKAALDVILEYFQTANDQLKEVIEELKKLGYDIEAKEQRKKEQSGDETEDNEYKEESEEDGLPPEMEF